MKRPAVIAVVAIVEVVFSIGGFLAVSRVSAAAPSWFSGWILFTAVCHLIAAIFLWRLNWIGPLMFVSVWIGMFVISLLVPHDPHLTAMRALTFVIVLTAYIFMTWRYRTLFSSCRIPTSV